MKLLHTSTQEPTHEIALREYIESRLTEVERHLEQITSEEEKVHRVLSEISAIRTTSLLETLRLIQADITKIQDTYTRESEMEKAIQAALRSVDVRFAHVESISSVIQENINLRFRDAERATALATASLDKRLEGMNEFRDQLREQAARFVTRTEMDDKSAALQQIYEATNKRLGELENARANLEGRMWAIGVFITIISLAISVGLHFVH